MAVDYLSNVCLFIPRKDGVLTLQTVHFVLETKQRTGLAPASESLYKAHLVKSGRGTLRTGGGAQPLAVGDVFFTFPGTPYAVDAVENFTYYYVSFLGERGQYLLEKADVRPQSAPVSGCAELLDVWEKALGFGESAAAEASESVLLYTLSFLAARRDPAVAPPPASTAASEMKRYLDEHFTDPSLSLAAISRALSYSPKYLSAAFKKAYGTGFAPYVNTLRLAYAKTMMAQGFTGVSDIAFCAGFRDAQYFSRVFKAQTGLSPAAFLKKTNG